MPLQQTSGNSTTDAYGGGVAVVPNYIEDVFSTWLYTGNGATQTITNGIDLSTKGGLTWIKSRNINGAWQDFFDTTRGVAQQLSSNNNGAQFNSPQTVTAFNSSGFSVGSDSDVNRGNAGDIYVSWTFRKQPKFFDIQTWTGSGANRTISHALGSAPGCIIVKRTDVAANWLVYHNGLTSAAYSIQLNLTNAQASATTVWNSTAPTTSVFSVGTDATVNASGGTYVAYLFAHNAGGFGLTGTDNVISCGSFTTDGSGNATVSLGYEPQWLLTKPVSGSTPTGPWQIIDNMRGFSVTGGEILAPNTAGAASTIGAPNTNPSATGFTIAQNSTTTYIYIAIRRGPMKVPTDGTKVFNSIARNGTSASATVTGASFPPDLVFPDVYNVGGTGAATFARLIGPNKYMVTYSTATEVTETASLLSYNMDGFSVGADNTGNGQINLSGNSYINWLFGRAPKFFDVVCYTGTGANTTQTHNLGAVPELIIVKGRSGATAWQIYASGLANTEYLVLNTTAAKATGATRWNSTTPTSTVFSLGTASEVNTSSATYVAYLFATCAGVSKVGSYTGNGTTQTIDCGLTAGARFVLIKRTDAAGGWYVYDTARGMTTLTDPYLLLNGNAAQTATLGSVTTVTTGFAVNAAILAAINTNAATYIFLAIA